jgi:hypothetical protein
MLGLTSGELTLVLILVGAVVSARFWPALGAAIAVRLGPARLAESSALPAEAKSQRTNDTDST